MRIQDIFDDRLSDLIPLRCLEGQDKGNRCQVNFGRHIKTDIDGPVPRIRKIIRLHLTGLPLGHVHVAVFLGLHPDVQHLGEESDHLLRDLLGDLIIPPDLLLTVLVGHADGICLEPQFLISDIGQVLIVFRVKLQNVYQVFVVLDVNVGVQHLRAVGIFLHIAGIGQVHAGRRDDHQQGLFGVGAHSKVVEFRRPVLVVFVADKDSGVCSVPVLSVILTQGSDLRAGSKMDDVIFIDLKFSEQGGAPEHQAGFGEYDL